MLRKHYFYIHEYEICSFLTINFDEHNLKITAGEKVIVVGRTGSGKSSLLRILLKLNDYTGSVTVNGREISKLILEVRKNYTVIPQDPLVLLDL